MEKLLFRGKLPLISSDTVIFQASPSAYETSFHFHQEIKILPLPSQLPTCQVAKSLTFASLKAEGSRMFFLQAAM